MIVIEPIVIGNTPRHRYSVWRSNDARPGAEQVTVIWCDTDEEAIAATLELARSDGILALVSEDTGSIVWEASSESERLDALQRQVDELAATVEWLEKKVSEMNEA